MQKKIKNNKLLRICFSLILIGFLEGCSNQESRDFFINMPEHENLKIDSTSFFLKGYGLSKDAMQANGQKYWKMTSEKGSLFYLQGYLRKEQNAIFLLPLDYQRSNSRQDQILFDFNLMNNKDWTVYFETEGNMTYGDSIIRSRTQVSEGDTIYGFDMYPFYHFKASNKKALLNPWFKVEVSLRKGILSIAAVETNADTSLYCTFSPLMLIDLQRGALHL